MFQSCRVHRHGGAFDISVQTKKNCLRFLSYCHWGCLRNCLVFWRQRPKNEMRTAPPPQHHMGKAKRTRCVGTHQQEEKGSSKAARMVACGEVGREEAGNHRGYREMSSNTKMRLR